MRRLVLVSILLAAAGCAVTRPQAAAPAVELRGHRFTVEFAADDASREHGLMMRTRLPVDHGMLFVFPDSRPRRFWMKNTLVPLDILYFNTDRTLVSMQLNVPPCTADPCPSYPSDTPARYVLELPAGTARRIDAQTGDELRVVGDVGAVH